MNNNHAHLSGIPENPALDLTPYLARGPSLVTLLTNDLRLWRHSFIESLATLRRRVCGCW